MALEKPILEVNQPVACCQPDLQVKSESRPASHSTCSSNCSKLKMTWDHKKYNYMAITTRPPTLMFGRIRQLWIQWTVLCAQSDVNTVKRWGSSKEPSKFGKMIGTSFCAGEKHDGHRTIFSHEPPAILNTCWRFYLNENTFSGFPLFSRGHFPGHFQWQSSWYYKQGFCKYTNMLLI